MFPFESVNQKNNYANTVYFHEVYRDWRAHFWQVLNHLSTLNKKKTNILEKNN